MSLVLNMSPELESRLRQEARRRNLDVAEYAERSIATSLPAPSAGPSLSGLFAEWEAEDGTQDPAELARREQEFEEFKAAMNRNRLDSEGPEARKPHAI